MLTIIIIAIITVAKVSDHYKALIIIGMFFALSGDIFLMLKKHNLFRYGLLSFLSAHIFYLIAIISVNGFSFRFDIILPFAIYLVVLYKFLISKVYKEKVGVFIYSIILVILLWQAFDRLIVDLDYSAILAAIGISLFAISDNVLAYNKFISRIEYAQLIILSTYYSAQLFIALSI